MLLPINGNNMTIAAAADLAAAVGCKLVIPAHFDMFPPCRVPVEDFVTCVRTKYPHIRVHRPQYCQPFTF